MTHKTMLSLAMHPCDYSRLAEAAAAAGYGVEDFALLSLHRVSEAFLAPASAPMKVMLPLPRTGSWLGKLENGSYPAKMLPKVA
ncbi:hypothetical protein AU476_27770 [Cupriavidus sp. UYMSc13B]|nr:hypothetical protein AU476_27770 [Cupriavidus sp. UYMSc13B]